MLAEGLPGDRPPRAVRRARGPEITTPGAPRVRRQTAPMIRGMSRARLWAAALGGPLTVVLLASCGGPTTAATGPSDTAVSPPPLSEPAMAFDSASQQLVMFGGGGSGMEKGTWSWQGGAWHRLRPRHSPPARQGAAMVYDPDLRELVLFGGTSFTVGDETKPLGVIIGGALTAQSSEPSNPGGANSQVTLSDTWGWNGSDWHELQSAIPHYQAQPDPQMAYDAADHTLLLDVICGSDCYSHHTRLWAWEAATSTWPRVTTPGAMPWNEAGQSDTAPAALDSSRPVFTPTANLGPSRAIVADPQTGGVLYVGQGQHNIFFGAEPNPPIDHSTTETWTLAQGAWHPLAPPSHPGTLLPTPILSDTGGPDVLLFDGFGQTWLWDGSTWTEQTGASPGVRSGAVMAFDPRSGDVVLYGGVGPSPGGVDADTWVWSSGSWRQVAGPVGPQPVASVWTQPDPPVSLAMSQADVLALVRANHALGNGPFASIEAKLVRNRDLERTGFGLVAGPQHGPETQPGRLTWVVVGFCKPPSASCGFSPSFPPAQPFGWALTTLDAVARGRSALSRGVGEGPGAAPKGWSQLVGLVPASSHRSTIIVGVASGAVLLLAASALLVRRRRRRTAGGER